MENINTVWAKTAELNGRIHCLLRLSTYEKYDDLSGLDINYQDKEQLFLLDELRDIMDKLSDVEDRISYLSLPIKKVSQLRLNESGRYETLHGHYYT